MFAIERDNASYAAKLSKLAPDDTNRPPPLPITEGDAWRASYKSQPSEGITPGKAPSSRSKINSVFALPHLVAFLALTRNVGGHYTRVRHASGNMFALNHLHAKLIRHHAGVSASHCVLLAHLLNIFHPMYVQLLAVVGVELLDDMFRIPSLSLPHAGTWRSVEPNTRWFAIGGDASGSVLDRIDDAFITTFRPDPKSLPAPGTFDPEDPMYTMKVQTYSRVVERIFRKELTSRALDGDDSDMDQTVIIERLHQYHTYRGRNLPLPTASMFQAIVDLMSTIPNALTEVCIGHSPKAPLFFLGAMILTQTAQGGLPAIIGYVNHTRRFVYIDSHFCLRRRTRTAQGGLQKRIKSSFMILLLLFLVNSRLA